MSWKCHSCNEQVAAKQSTCGKCGSSKPNIESDGIMNPAGKPVPNNFRPGDWMCPTCSRHVYSSKPQCICGNQKPQAAWDREKAHNEKNLQSLNSPSATTLTALTSSTVPKSSSNQVNSQQQHQYRRNPDVPPPPNFKPGDWICPSCGDHVFARKDYCRCGCSKPDKDISTFPNSSCGVPTNGASARKEESSVVNEALNEEMRIILKAQKSLMEYEMALVWSPLGVDWTSKEMPSSQQSSS